MKKILFFAMAALMCMSCAAKKPVAQQQPVQQTQQPQAMVPQEDPEIAALEKAIKIAKLNKELAAVNAEVTTYSVPCLESSFDDKDYFRDYGIGNVEGGNDQAARQVAAEAAKNLIKIRLGEYVEGITDFFMQSYNGSTPKTAVEDRARRKLNGVVQEFLDNADKICENPGIDPKGNKSWYYAIQIPKKELNNAIEETLSSDEKLKTDFDAEQMQKFMDERMQAMLEAKKNAGYK